MNDFCKLNCAVYSVHENIHIPVGVAILSVVDTLHSNSSKQKSSTKSSTEAELVGVSDYLS